MSSFSNNPNYQEYYRKFMYYYNMTRDLIDNTIDNIQYSLNYEGSNESTNPNFQSKTGLGRIGTTAFFLGVIGGVHLGFLVLITLVYYSSREEMSSICISLYQWSLYMSLLCFFHFSEFFTTAVYQPTTLSYDSFIINHSKNYTTAALAAWVEFWIESILFGSTKRNYTLIFIGLALIILGQVVRTIAMCTCGNNFSHVVKEVNEDGHKLVTHGIYSVLRHPAYFGWFYWSVGTQLFLCNPICTVFYTWASWYFFSARIPHEESLLLREYPTQYAEYTSKTYICIPFINSSTSSGPAGNSDK